MEGVEEELDRGDVASVSGVSSCAVMGVTLFEISLRSARVRAVRHSGQLWLPVFHHMNMQSRQY